ncbi:kinase-like domain-containing protein [Cercophora scortea]|uniref:non-specific serine/threonine protein kinase n=1 Tax=Cercophora scortea TaxID=314031 RepID=A0AAE0IFQ2_9PEZI|nr:kinase-like domain-containing protein [Cercophora scortea]
MASVSSDEGEIVEASPLPRSAKDGDVDRNGRHRARLSPAPEHGLIPPPRPEARPSAPTPASPSRGFKRSRPDDRERDRRDPRDSRDPRQFRIHYEQVPPRDDHRHTRDSRDRDFDRHRDLDRPTSRGSNHNSSSNNEDHRSNHRFNAGDAAASSSAAALPSRPGMHHQPDERSRGYEPDRSYDGYANKRPRNRSRSPRGRRDRGKRDRARYGLDSRPEENKYSAQAERRSQDGSMSKRATPVEASDNSRHDAKYYQGVTVERGINGLAISQTSNSTQGQGQPQEPEPDWDEAAAIDPEAAAEAEIQRRRRAREEAYKRGIGAVTPTIQALQAGDKAPSSPSSTRQSTPGPLKTEVNTPQSNAASSPALSPAKVQDAMSPAALNFADEQQLIKAHGDTKMDDEDGPSAADYDPTADMKEDERRDEMRYGNVGLHGEARTLSVADIAVEKVEEAPAKQPAVDEDEDEDFDMFADDFDEKKFAAAPAPSTAAPTGDDAHGVQQPNGGGGGILEGDDKDGYYKIRPGEVLEGRYQISSALGRGMFSGVARAVDITTKRTVAIKIMRNNDALRKGGFTEIAILQKLNAADPENKKHMVKFERSFEYKGHLCMVFENLSLNLREVLKKFGNNVGINLNATRAYAYQIFLALGHMRKCSIIHADLKPDNILVNENRNVLKICDLGTAIDRSDAATASTEITPYLVSRFYRAPEIILGLPYDYAVDMWSIGCTLYELYTGKILFTGDSNNQMLKNIMEIRGKLNAKLYRRGQLSSMHFDDLGNFLSVERDKVLGKVSRNERRRLYF